MTILKSQSTASSSLLGDIADFLSFKRASLLTVLLVASLAVSGCLHDDEEDEEEMTGGNNNPGGPNNPNPVNPVPGDTAGLAAIGGNFIYTPHASSDGEFGAAVAYSIGTGTTQSIEFSSLSNDGSQVTLTSNTLTAPVTLSFDDPGADGLALGLLNDTANDLKGYVVVRGQNAMDTPVLGNNPGTALTVAYEGDAAASSADFATDYEGTVAATLTVSNTDGSGELASVFTFGEESDAPTFTLTDTITDAKSGWGSSATTVSAVDWDGVVPDDATATHDYTAVGTGTGSAPGAIAGTFTVTDIGADDTAGNDDDSVILRGGYAATEDTN